MAGSLKKGHFWRKKSKVRGLYGTKCSDDYHNIAFDNSVEADFVYE
jgi:hypothetical protein